LGLGRKLSWVEGRGFLKGSSCGSAGGSGGWHRNPPGSCPERAELRWIEGEVGRRHTHAWWIGDGRSIRPATRIRARIQARTQPPDVASRDEKPAATSLNGKGRGMDFGFNLTRTANASALRLLPNRWDFVAFPLIICVLALTVVGFHETLAPISTLQTQAISLDPANLPEYALRTTLRMLAAMVASLVFTLIYGTLAAKSRRASIVLVPILDILQSVPVLGYISFTVTFFLALFPGRVFGAELAAIFAIFTSQAWNMTFSFYQSLRTVPRDLDEVSRGFHLTNWQRFWKLEVPFSMPGLIWNMMMSMSGGWFFVVASEAIVVGNRTIVLPGIGAYLATAVGECHLGPIG